MLKFAIVLAAVAVCCVQAENQYRLYTKNNRQGVNMSRAEIILPADFETDDKTIILIHGHGGSIRHAFNTQIMEEIFPREETFNVIVVDWAAQASGSYSSARANVMSVAHDLREFLRHLYDRIPATGLLVDNIGLDVSKMHLVGFGLGAHIAGIASRDLALSLSTVGRISGLDPSGSDWDSRSPRLKRGDAKYVEIIHTDGSGLLANGIGTALGDKDFFANGGSNQPGCHSHSCSHNRAYELFAASMRGHLVGNGCSSMMQMNLNLCRGAQVKMGGTDLTKARSHQIYKIKTGRIYPF